MSTFADFIVENFHSEANLIWRLEGLSRAVGAFEVRNLTVEVSLEQRESQGSWHVAFQVIGGGRLEAPNCHLAFRIFNGVFQSVREFIETRQPDSIVFISKDDDLAGTYGAYLRREKSAIESLGYTLEGPHRVDPYTEYTLRRTHPSNWRP